MIERLNIIIFALVVLKKGEMTYLYINDKGKYEKMENRKELGRVFMFLFGLSLMCVLIGLCYLMFSNF